MSKLRKVAKELTDHLDALFKYLYLSEPGRLRAKNWQRMRNLNDDLKLEIAREESIETLPAPDEDHIGKFRRDARVTSRQAALEVKPRSGTQRMEILAEVARLGPMTDEGIQKSLHMNANTERPRRLELVEGGWLEDSGYKGATDCGQFAVKWQLTKKAVEHLPELGEE